MHNASQPLGNHTDKILVSFILKGKCLEFGRICSYTSFFKLKTKAR